MRTGSSLAVLVLLAGLMAVPAAGKKPKEKPEPPVYALIAGTAYRPPGFALPGCKIRVQPAGPEAGGVRLKPAEVVTDSRGEFAIRVPVVPMKWTVSVQSSGYETQTRTVEIDGEQRHELSVVLEPAKGKGDTK